MFIASMTYKSINYQKHFAVKASFYVRLKVYQPFIKYNFNPAFVQ